MWRPTDSQKSVINIQWENTSKCQASPGLLVWQMHWFGWSFNNNFTCHSKCVFCRESNFFKQFRAFLIPENTLCTKICAKLYHTQFIAANREPVLFTWEFINLAVFHGKWIGVRTCVTDGHVLSNKMCYNSLELIIYTGLRCQFY